MELFVELHEGNPDQARPLHVAVNDIRLVRPKGDADLSYLTNVSNTKAYKTCIIFKGDGWRIFVHESPETVLGLCGFKISR